MSAVVVDSERLRRVSWCALATIGAGSTLERKLLSITTLEKKNCLFKKKPFKSSYSSRIPTSREVQMAFRVQIQFLLKTL